ncbi:MAG: hypothetical protein AAFV95_22095 [Bacteroidota bacterium]
MKTSLLTFCFWCLIALTVQSQPQEPVMDQTVWQSLQTDLQEVGDETSVAIKFYYGITGVDRCCEFDREKDLDKLWSIIKFLQDRPKAKIEIGSHTDCRGAKRSNLASSRRNLRSLKEELKTVCDSIDQTELLKRVAFRGYGESRPLEECECGDCSSEQHARNNRLSIRLLKM